MLNQNKIIKKAHSYNIIGYNKVYLLKIHILYTKLMLLCKYEHHQNLNILASLLYNFIMH